MAKNKKNKHKSSNKASLPIKEVPSPKLAKEKQVLQNLIDKDDYAAALNQLAVMVENNLYDADVLYAGAYCYFMLCDYERAAGWLDNTLSVDNGHVKARLLLARLCLLEDRAETGLTIYDFVLKNYGNVLTVEQKDEIKDVLDYYAHHEQEMLANFHNLQQFLGIGNEVMGDKEVSGDEMVSVDDAAKAQEDIVARNIADTLARPWSVQEKVRVFNSFAGGHFFQGENDKAVEYLRAALDLDEYNDITLKNAAILYARQGDREKALNFASRMRVTDFALLEKLQ